MLVAMSLTLTLPLPGRADDAHHRSNLLGERALGMGGAWTGLADDPSAAYYNPGGLAMLQRRSLSTSLQLDGFEHVRVQRPLGALSERDFVFDERVSIPVFVSGAVKLGKRDPDGFRRHAVAFSRFHPSHRSTDFSLDAGRLVGGRSLTRHDDLVVSDSDRTVWIGPSYAYAFDRRAALGLSVFLSDRVLVHSEERTQVDEGPGDRLHGNTEGFFTEHTTVKLYAKHIVLRLGGIYQAAPRVRFGFMLQPPGITLRASSSRRYQYLTRSEDGEGVYHHKLDAHGLPAQSPIPWELRLGVGIFASDTIRVGLDFSVHGPNGSPRSPVRRFGTGGRRDLELPGLLIAETFYREPVANANLGVEASFGSSVVLRGGVFTDASAAPAVRAGDRYMMEDVSRVGVSASIGLDVEEFELATGGYVRWGRGSALGLDTRADAEHVYTPRALYDRTITFFISGHVSSAGRLLERGARRLLGAEAVDSQAEPSERVREAPPKAAPDASSAAPDQASDTDDKPQNGAEPGEGSSPPSEPAQAPATP